jgi:hypothetical protein
MSTKIENGQIVETMLGTGDHGISTFYLRIKCADGLNFGFGGYPLDEYDEQSKTRVATAHGLQAIMNTMKCVGVSKWEDMNGQFVRCEHEGWGGQLVRIGHPVNDQWFSLNDFYHEQRKEASVLPVAQTNDVEEVHASELANSRSMRQGIFDDESVPYTPAPEETVADPKPAQVKSEEMER